MSINLKIICHGMIAYVPSPDNSQMAAILCKAPDEVVPNQAAYVRFPVANFTPTKTRKPLPPPDDAPTRLKNHGHVLLNNERLSLVASSGESLKIDFSKDPRNKKETPTGRDHRSFHWMPNIDKLTNGAGDINSLHLTNPAAANPQVLARVDFTQGRLGTTGVEKVKVPFKREGNADVEKMALAREALLELTIDQNEFILRSVNFDGTHTPENDLKFTTQGDSNLEIVIGNEPTADIYKETPPSEPIDTIAARARGEFDLFYNLCETRPDNPPLPHILVRPGLHTFCSGGRYNPSKDVTG